MNSRVLSLLAGVAVATVAAIASAPAHAVPTSTSGLGCRATAATTNLQYQADGVYNAGSSWAEVICPVSWSQTYGSVGTFEPSGSGAYSWGVVSAYAQDGTFHASAYWDSYDWTIYGYSYYVGWAPLYGVNSVDVISSDVWMPPGGKVRGIWAQ